MTDNEKRAHDLAIACIPIIYRAHLSNSENIAQETNGSITDFPIDIFKEYLKTYDIALEAFNKHFKI